MSAAILFQAPEVLQWGIPICLLAVLSVVWWQRRRGLTWTHVAALGSLRSLLLVVLLFLLAEPVSVSRDLRWEGNPRVTVLMDRSESMDLESSGATRYEQAYVFLRDKLLPALKSANMPVQAVTFAESSELADSRELASTPRDGKRTNLAGAIAHAYAAAAVPPMAIIALTDGCVNETRDNARALALLAESGTPFIGIGVGSDDGARSLTLRHVYAPANVRPRTAFSISAQLECHTSELLPSFDLLLFRDGQLVQKKTVSGVNASRQWLEDFRVTEEIEGNRTYTVQVIPPNVRPLTAPALTFATNVRVSDEREIRVLYIQGALTWDYKFVKLALREDPAIRITGLTRTAERSIYRQNVESAGELLNGFPATLEELAPFRVVVLSNLRPFDLTIPQQEVLAKFCGELGGGLLMMGGSDTFDRSWHRSRLEDLLPVVFASLPAGSTDHPFRVELTEQALQHPLFQLSDDGRTMEHWSKLPAFRQYGRVDAVKAGAQVWMRHPGDHGPNGKRVLMAAERYGAGISAVLCIQNFWRWRLAKESDPAMFDRFWRQLFRYLSNSAGQDVLIHLPEQDLRPNAAVRVLLEKQPNPSDLAVQQPFWVRVKNSRKELIRKEQLKLEPGRPVDFEFQAADADAYSVAVLDNQEREIAVRSIDIRELNLELLQTARNMESLRQWAGISGGIARKIEECDDAGEIARQISARIEQLRRTSEQRRPIGIDAWILALVLGSLCSEWILRKQWRLV